MQGYIIKGYSGFYYVKSGEKIYECSLRGKSKKKDMRFLSGDLVEFLPLDDEKGVIEKRLERRNELIRPPIANVDQLVIVAAAKNPAPDYMLIDRMCIIALWNHMEPILCFNKIDLATDRDSLHAHYRHTGFQILNTSTKTGEGIEDLKQVLTGKISAFAGNSGVGKSSLLNALEEQERVQTGEISQKLKRGKHTTRHVELFPLAAADTFIADTPGFSALELPKEMKREELSRYYPDFMQYLSDCKFATSQHRNEPECKVKEAVAQGEIAQSRYDNYLLFLDEVIANERSF